uniref:(northern house mosquito) hypothetical protein n=1 Tax=Culex pipiens TaxID=7175 RepID=A0A8D8BGY7_CULPI
MLRRNRNPVPHPGVFGVLGEAHVRGHDRPRHHQRLPEPVQGQLLAGGDRQLDCGVPRARHDRSHEVNGRRCGQNFLAILKTNKKNAKHNGIPPPPAIIIVKKIIN